MTNTRYVIDPKVSVNDAEFGLTRKNVPGLVTITIPAEDEDDDDIKYYYDGHNLAYSFTDKKLSSMTIFKESERYSINPEEDTFEIYFKDHEDNDISKMNAEDLNTFIIENLGVNSSIFKTVDYTNIVCNELKMIIEYKGQEFSILEINA